MRISNDSDAPRPSGAFAELLRLQTDFQARLADETLRYLRQLQGIVAPSSPGTFAVPANGLELESSARAGTTARLSVEVENLQRAHCLVAPHLSPLVSADGTTWFPEVTSGGGSRLVAPSTVVPLEMEIPVPAALPPGTYRGALMLQGFRDGVVPVSVIVPSSNGHRPRAKRARRK